MSPERLKEIRVRCDAASGESWLHGWGELILDSHDGSIVISKAYNRSFICHARQDLPDCLDEIDRLKAREKYLEMRIQELREQNKRLMRGSFH